MVAHAQQYDPSIPTPDSVLGYPLGARVTDYAGMERYLSTLAKASPRVVYGAYGSDYENRELRYLVVSSEENIGRLDDIKSANTRLTDPRKLSPGDASSLIEKTPVTVWLNCSTDGNETAGLESALMMAYHLAAATDGETKRLLEGVVVVLTPLMNPSSHERWASWSNAFAAGPAGNPDPLAMEHNPPWGILTNNNDYLVDLNRESIWATQKESAALRDFYYEWNPMVFIDLHGEYDNFVGPGYQEPLNPLYTEAQRQWFDRFGKAIGRTFAGLGWSYSAWETGSFYPGFWESFGALNGAVGFTYETTGGGSKGLRYRRDDGSIITLRLAAEQHFQASLAVIETSVGARKELMADFAAFWRGARAAEERAFLIERGSDPARADLLIETLLANRVEVFKSKKDLSITNVHDYFGRHWNERSFQAGVYVVPVDQPQARLVLTMLRKDFELPKVTRDAAREFRRNQEKASFYNPKIGATGYIFYDVTAWSMPLTFDFSGYWTEAPIVGDLSRVDAIERESPPRPPEAQYGYVFRGQSNASMAFLIDLIQQGVVTNVAYSDFRIQGRDYSRGSIVIRKERNPDVDLEKLLGAASERHGVRIDALDSNYSEDGPSLGSDQFVFVKRPKIAILAGDPVGIRSFGNTWFVLERLNELAFTAIYREQLNEDTLDEYNVLVLPDGDYDDRTFSEQWIEALGGLDPPRGDSRLFQERIRMACQFRCGAHLLPHARANLATGGHRKRQAAANGRDSRRDFEDGPRRTPLP